MIAPFVLLTAVRLCISLNLYIHLAVFLLVVYHIHLVVSRVFLPFFNSCLAPWYMI
nr:MAG TPA: hypothetical protein [Caudoviricetes sp.]